MLYFNATVTHGTYGSYPVHIRAQTPEKADQAFLNFLAEPGRYYVGFSDLVPCHTLEGWLAFAGEPREHNVAWQEFCYESFWDSMSARYSTTSHALA